jgi:hypothetical protein
LYILNISLEKMKSVAALLSLIVLVVSVHTQIDPNCPEGKCAKCTYTGEERSCDSCYYSSRYLTAKKQSQNKDHFACSATNNITLDNCISLELDPATGLSKPDVCAVCQKSFYLNPDTKKCEKFQVSNCISGETSIDNKQVCTMCVETFSV